MLRACNKVFLRKLKLSDAVVSKNWRNDEDIWIYTGSRPKKIISLEDEKQWLKVALKEKDSLRFAILNSELNERVYVGNVQITNVVRDCAEFHIFIGSRKHWGQGIAYCATKLLCFVAFSDLNLEYLYLYVHSENTAAIRLYLKSGFKIISVTNNKLTMHLTKRKFFKMLSHEHIRYCKTHILQNV